MSDAEPVFVPANAYDESKEEGVFSRFGPGTRTLPKGFRLAKHYGKLLVDITFEKDVPVQLRDGVTIYVDVFRPAGATDIPAIVAWSPYGKSRGAIPSVTATRKRLGIDQSNLSGLMKFEGPDPGFWCAHGYAICNPDARGAFNSEGDIQFFGEQEGRDACDLVEWLAGREWCNGKVGMSGNSYLAVSQWFTAAEQPPHLAAIAPWEGFSDVYRDVLRRGGIPDATVAVNLMKLNFTGKHRMEDAAAAVERYPLMNDYWRSKIPAFERITVPAYVVASYSNTFHTQGTFRAWERMASSEKWLRIHHSMEWPDYYEQENLLDLLEFFDHYLRGKDNEWPSTPRVRYSLLDLDGHDVTGKPAGRFPPVNVEYAKYYLDGRSSALSPARPAAESRASYDSAAEDGRVEFTVAFDRETLVVGYLKAKLWVEADGHDDMDLFVFAQKLDAGGKQLQVMDVQTNNLMLHLLTRKGASILKYKGPNGRLRVSLRHLDGSASTDVAPVQAFDRIEKLEPGQVVPVEIAMHPAGLIFRPGEKLRLVVSGHNLVGGPMPGMADVVPDNHGRHVVHAGGRYDSYLQLPVLGGLDG